jgi:large subunit ribosomal protein L23
MKLKDPHKIIVKPIITEKSTLLRTESNIFQFYIRPDATKKLVKQSVEELFKVDVLYVRIINLPGKPRRRGLYTGKTKSRKKALVKVKDGQNIPIFEGLV